MKILFKPRQFINNLNQTKTCLLLGDVFLVFFSIALFNLKVIPMRTGDFIFFAALTLALALYRPGWAFLLFIGTIILENINLAPESFFIAIRPYQFIGALIILAIIIRLFTKRLNFQLAKLKFPDYLVLIMAAAGFLSIFAAPDKIDSLKLAVIFTSFAALYYLVRCYIQNTDDLKKIVPFFIGSSAVVVLYGLWQNIRFIYGGANFETMPGRPNLTFTEPDWAGMYLIILISVLYSFSHFINSKFETLNPEQYQNPNLIANRQSLIAKLIYYLFLVLAFITLILTVSRSAWIGAFAAMSIFLFAILTNLRFKGWQWGEFLKQLSIIISAGIISLACVYIFNLTNFQLFNRVQSAGSGLQKITISCTENKKPPESINSADELEKFGCRHINLEEIEKEKIAGNIIYEIYRDDPNINIRQKIYQKSWEQIKKHPLLGIGWGSIGMILGEDERGASLNSSNIFLEVWLGSGIVGFLAFSVLFFYILSRWIKNYFYSDNAWQKTVGLFMLISWFAIVISNLFNAGLFLGFLWVWLAAAQLKIDHN